MWKDRFFSALGSLLAVLSILVAVGAMAIQLFGKIAIDKALIGLGGAVLGFGVSYLYLYFLKRKHPSFTRIFLSYAHEDRELSHKLSEDLRQIGYEVLLPEEEIKVGDNITERIDESLNRSDLMVAIISPRSSSSEWVSRELDMARQKRLRIVPVVVDDAQVPRNIQDVKYIKGESYPSTYKALRNAVGQYKRLGYRIRTPREDPVDYGPDEFRKAEEHYLHVKNKGGKWYEVQRGFDGVVRENDMIR